jgi:hypothetical protein
MTELSLRRWLGVVVLGLAVMAGGGTQAEPLDDDGFFSIQFENDIFGNTDQHFTHGTRLSWMSPENKVPEWAKDAASLVPLFDVSASKRIVFTLGQSILTPDDISQSALISDDRPYAGWTYLGIGMVAVKNDRLDNLELDIGVVGPSSGAEDVQKTWHRWFGFQRPNGWDNQLKDEPGVMLSYERKWRKWARVRFASHNLDVDMTPHLGATLGNVLTQGAAGITFRLGSDLVDHFDYGPPRIRPSLPGSSFFTSSGGFNWYVFVGAEARGVVNNIFLDGNNFRDSHSVNKKDFVGDVQGGVALIIGRVRLAYTHVLRTKEFDGQDHSDQFGAFSISAIF